MLLNIFIIICTGHLYRQCSVLQLYRLYRREPCLVQFLIVFSKVVFYHFKAVCPYCFVTFLHLCQSVLLFLCLLGLCIQFLFVAFLMLFRPPRLLVIHFPDYYFFDIFSLRCPRSFNAMQRCNNSFGCLVKYFFA